MDYSHFNFNLILNVLWSKLPSPSWGHSFHRRRVLFWFWWRTVLEGLQVTSVILQKYVGLLREFLLQLNIKGVRDEDNRVVDEVRHSQQVAVSEKRHFRWTAKRQKELSPAAMPSANFLLTWQLDQKRTKSWKVNMLRGTQNFRKSVPTGKYSRAPAACQAGCFVLSARWTWSREPINGMFSGWRTFAHGALGVGFRESK